MMQQTLVPVLLLAAVALSSSNVLPMMSDRLDPHAMYGQQNDNILSNRYSKAVHNNIIYTLPIGSSENKRLMRKFVKYLNDVSDRTGEISNDVINEEDNYDGEGFRKEQWHNYPRQMDRLHEYLTHYHNGNMKRNLDTDDPGTEYYDLSESKERNLGDITNEYLSNDIEVKYICDSIIAGTNPLLILKVHLACLRYRLKKTRSSKLGAQPFQTQINNENDLEDNIIIKTELNPATKVKREDMTSQETNSDETTPAKAKRLFSLWSRLQSLSHKGHELPHRRHIPFYGFPEGQGGSKLTAETRAMMRPPGSPLRWG